MLAMPMRAALRTPGEFARAEFAQFSDFFIDFFQWELLKGNVYMYLNILIQLQQKISNKNADKVN